jgi:hypothetical protein
MIKPLLMAAMLAIPLYAKNADIPQRIQPEGDVITNVSINFNQTQEVESVLSAEQTTEQKEPEQPEKKGFSKKVIAAGCVVAAGAVKASWYVAKVIIFDVWWGAVL